MAPIETQNVEHKNWWQRQSKLSKAAGILLILMLLSVLMSRPNSGPSSDSTQPTPPPATDVSLLELQSWSWHEEYGYAVVEGLVKNISKTNLENVEAEVSFSSKDGTFITSSDALIDYNPILPNQSSPFKVMTTYNPEMKKALIDFKFLAGETIPWKAKNGTSKK